MVRRSSPLLRAAVLLGLCIIAKHTWGPAFTVKGSWDGELEEIKDGLFRGMAPKSVTGVRFSDGALSLATEDGHLKAGWSSGPLSVSVDDSNAWQANYTESDSHLHMRGEGASEWSWEASKHGSVKGLGDVEVNVTSAGEFGVELEPELPLSEVAGVTLKALTSSHGDGIYGKLQADRKLSKHAHATYTVENDEGDYSLANLKHAAALSADIKDGSLKLHFAKASDSHSYDATYSHDLGKILQGDSAVAVGVDNDGVYGHFAKDHQFAKGVSANYEAKGRASMSGDSKDFSHSVKLGNDMGALTLSHGIDAPVSADLEMGHSLGAATFEGKVGYALNDDAPTFNLKASSDLGAALAELEGSLVLGIDDASADGLYGKVHASRKFGDYTVDLSSGGRAKSLEHSLKVSNDLGHAELVQSGDSAPRVRFGYSFDV